MFLCYIVDIENGNPEAGPGNESWSGRIIYAGEVPVRRHRLWYMRRFVIMRKKTVWITTAAVIGVMCLGGCAAAPASATSIPEVITVRNEDSQDGELTLNSSESVTVTPDMAEIVYGITTEDTDAVACQQKNMELLNQLVEYLKGQDISESSITTSRFSMVPQYDWSGNTRTLLGYRMDTEVTVTDIAVADVGTLLSNGVNAGANEIYSVSYFSSQYDTAYADALAKAVDAARTKAEVLAEASGKTLGKVLNIQEYQDSQSGRYKEGTVNMSRDAAEEAAGVADMNVMPGEMDVTANISIEFELVDQAAQ